MNVVLFGRDSIIEKATLALNCQGIRTTNLSRNTDPSAAAEHAGGAQLALIEAEAEGAQAVNQRIRERLGIPTVLIMTAEADSWEQADALQPAGYVLDSFKNGELAAHLAAIVRRTAAGGEGSRA